MFSFSRPKKPTYHIGSLLNNTAKIQGTLSFSDGFQLQGLLDGNIVGSSGSVLVIDQAAVVTGSVEAEVVIVDGTVHGNITGFSSIVIRPNGQVFGDIYYEKIQMEEGATVSGSLIPRKKNQSRPSSQHSDPSLPETTSDGLS